MCAWGVEMTPQGTVGSKVVRAVLRNDNGQVTVTGVDDAVRLLIEDLTQKVTLPAPAPKLARFVLVDAEGNYVAMAFEFVAGTEIGLAQIEEIENFASQKLGRSVLAVTWSLMDKPHPRENVVGEPVEGTDIIGGVRCSDGEEVDPAVS